MNDVRSEAVEIWNAGVDSVRADALLRRETTIQGDQLQIGELVWSLHDFDRLVVIGAGKAGAGMAAGLRDRIGDSIPVTGWINVPEGTERTVPGIHIHAARPAGVNEPTPDGVRGTRQILDLVRNAHRRDLCVALFSGGGSALLPAPIDAISLDDKRAVTRFLSAAGADITELNTVRKQLSLVKGGGLLDACNAGYLVTVVLSDVLGDPLDMIASGPTVPDSSSPEDAIEILRKFDTGRSLPPSIYLALESAPTITASDARPAGGQRSRCPHQTIVIGNNAVAVDHAGIKAESLGYNHAMQSATRSEGPAEQMGQRMAQMAIHMLRADPDLHRTDCLISGGEPTVQLVPSDQRGRGGRNQQLVLAAYQYLRNAALSDAEWDRFALLSGGTDGEDGPTDAAGAVIDGNVHRQAVQSGLDADEFLRRNDAYSFFESCGGLMITGPTGTNVCDLRVLVVKP